MYDINGNIVTRDTPTNLLVTNPISGAVRPGGSQGFPGYSTDIGKSRNNFAAYVDTELDITKKWMISLAGRFENYNDFGSTLNGKFATRYAFTPQFAFGDLFLRVSELLHWHRNITVSNSPISREGNW